jgi:parvulin-like peptidyl-prolyl isomerase
VNTWPITVADLDRAVWEYCTVRGMRLAKIDPQRMEVIRAVVLGRMIDDLAVWHFSRVDPIPIEEAEIDAAVAGVRGHFTSDEAFAKRLATQEMDQGSFREHIADQVHQRKWLEAKAAKHITVSEEEVRTWFEADEESRSLPQRWRARQIFMATLDKDPQQVGAAMAEVAQAITTGELTFEAAVRGHSEDERSKKAGGDLGYFSRERMPEDFVEAIAAQPPGGAGAPFQTELGWHLVEVTEILQPRQANFEEMRDEIRAHLESQKRKDVIDQIVRDYRKRSKIWPPEPKPRALLSSP